VRRAANLTTFTCRLCWNVGASTSRKPVQACNGIALRFPYNLYLSFVCTTAICTLSITLSVTHQFVGFWPFYIFMCCSDCSPPEDESTLLLKHRVCTIGDDGKKNPNTHQWYLPVTFFLKYAKQNVHSAMLRVFPISLSSWPCPLLTYDTFSRTCSLVLALGTAEFTALKQC
jgi:hypothetical protein